MRTMASYLTRARLILDALKADKSAEPLADTVVEAAERWLSPHDVDAVPAPLSNAMDQADAARCGFAAAGEKSLALLSRGVHMVNASIEADRLGQPMVQVAYDGYKTGMEHLTSFYRGTLRASAARCLVLISPLTGGAVCLPQRPRRSSSR